MASGVRELPSVRMDELIGQRAAARGKDVAFTYLDYSLDSDGVPLDLTWEELDRRAKALAVRIDEAGIRGCRAAVLAPHGLDYVVAFFGCLYSGSVAVPLFSPSQQGHGNRLISILGDCRPEAILTTASDLDAVHEFLEASAVPRPQEVIAVDTLDESISERWKPVEIGADTLAYLQYTSGSTSTPAGVVITHGNFVTNTEQVAQHYGLDDRITGVSWLPFFHDMGLITVITLPVLLGVRSVFTAPFSFIHRPIRWLRMLASYPQALSAAPNFAYEYCLQRVPEQKLAELDFSGVRALLNGAEPIRAETIERFAEVFERHGLPAEAQRPSYGLAEATVFVSGSARPVITSFDGVALTSGKALACDGEVGPTRRLVAAGTAGGPEVRIVDPERRVELPEQQVGEIWVHGENVSSGYWRNAERTTESFENELTEPLAGTPSGPWLRTGDLGFQYEGLLYITGRSKDLIIVDGANHYPSDIEQTVERVHPAVRDNRVAAFGVDVEGEERVVIVAEIDPRKLDESGVDALGRGVGKAVMGEHNVRVHEFLAVRAGAIPRTSSGKVQRSSCRTRYQTGEWVDSVLA